MKNLKNFGITFGVSLIILGIISLFVTGIIDDAVCGIFEKKNKSLDNILSIGESSAQNQDNSDKTVNGSSFTWLMVVSDYRPGVIKNYYPSSSADVDALDDFKILGDDYSLPVASDIILVHANVEAKTYVIMSIPSVSKITTEAGEFTLGEVYALNGAVKLCSWVESMTGINIDYYSVIHSTDLSALANICGTIECTIPKTIYSSGSKYFSLEETTKADTTETTKSDETTAKPKKTETTKEETTEPLVNELDKAESVQLANKLMAAMLYYEPSDGISDEMIVQQSFANGLLSNLSSYSDSQLESMLSSMKNYLVSTNLSADAIYLSGEVIRAFKWFDVMKTSMPGKFVTSKGSIEAYFKPDIGKCTSFFYNYR